MARYRLAGAGAALWLWLLGTVAAAAAPAAALPSKKDAWIRVNTAHFTIYSNGSEGKAKDIGLEFERLRAVLARLKPDLKVNSPMPTTIFVFRNESTFEPYEPLYQGKPMRVAGFYQPSHDGNFMTVLAGWNVDARARVYHEFLHEFLDTNLPPQPLWFEEGMADFYSTFRATDDEAEIGRPVEDHVRWLREKTLLPLDQLFAVDHSSPEYNEESRRGVFYAESWALVHYLMVGDPKRAEQLARFLILLQSGKPQREAFQEAFGGADSSKMLGELTRYARGNRFLFMRVPMKDLKVSSEMTTAPVSYEQALVALGNMLAHSQEEQMPFAEAHLQAALGTKSVEGDALASLAYLRMRQENNAEALDLLRHAVAANTRDFQAYNRYGVLLLRSLSGEAIPASGLEGERRKTLDDARAAFRKSIELNPSFAEAHAGLGETYLWETTGNAADGIPEMELAVKQLPSREDLRIQLVRLYQRQGEEERANALLKTLGKGGEALATHGDSNGNGEFELNGTNRVNKLLAEGKDEEGLAVMEEIVAKASPNMKPALQEQLDQLRAGVARNRCVKQYNEAIQHWNKHELKAALEGFEQVAATATDPKLVKSAKEKAQIVRETLARSAKSH